MIGITLYRVALIKKEAVRKGRAVYPVFPLYKRNLRRLSTLTTELSTQKIDLWIVFCGFGR
jgi:hypothetical protein